MPHKFDPSHRELLESPERYRMLPAQEILTWAGLSEDHILADLGCGTGFFTIPASSIVGVEGRIYAVDTSSEMLDEVRARVRASRVGNVKVVKSKEYQIPLSLRSIDFALLAFVIHEVTDKVRFLGHVKKLLRPEGKIIIVEWKKAKSLEGPPLEDRISKEEIVEMARKINLGIERKKDLNPSHYIVVFSVS